MKQDWKVIWKIMKSAWIQKLPFCNGCLIWLFPLQFLPSLFYKSSLLIHHKLISSFRHGKFLSLRSGAYPGFRLVQEWHTNDLNYNICNSRRGNTLVPLSTAALFQRLYLNMQGISIEEQARDDYGNNSPTKDWFHGYGRILPYAGGKRDMVWRSERREGAAKKGRLLVKKDFRIGIQLR